MTKKVPEHRLDRWVEFVRKAIACDGEVYAGYHARYFAHGTDIEWTDIMESARKLHGGRR